MEFNEGVRRGQIAHINRRADDDRFDNLVWLCLEHHDQYDSPTSQSKNLTADELRAWRLALVRRFNGPSATWSVGEDLEGVLVSRPSGKTPGSRTERSWRYPLWQVDGQPDLFAFTAGNRSDGVCLIERIDLPDGRVVIACLEAVGNPGTSITNAVEEIARQVCLRFEIDPRDLIWLEHYPKIAPLEWDRVTFGSCSADGTFLDPTWSPMSGEDWRGLGLEPASSTTGDGYRFFSNINRRFRGLN